MNQLGELGKVRSMKDLGDWGTLFDIGFGGTGGLPDVNQFGELGKLCARKDLGDWGTLSDIVFGGTGGLPGVNQLGDLGTCLESLSCVVVRCP